MKKYLFALLAVVATATLSSFVINNKHSQETDMGNDFIFYKSVEGWHEATESTTIYIYYKEGNGERRYYSGPRQWGAVDEVYTIRKNPLYRSSACKDFRRNYQYVEGPSHYLSYFNCNLPKFNQ